MFRANEVENALFRHPAVASCAVIGVPSEKWGEEVHAVVVLEEGHEVTPEELIGHCHQSIAGYKCPRGITFRDEPLPLSGAVKVLKRELRAPFWEGQDRQVSCSRGQSVILGPFTAEGALAVDV